MKMIVRAEHYHHPRRRLAMERILIAAGIAGFVLAYGFACYKLSAVMKDTCSSLAILATIGN